MTAPIPQHLREAEPEDPLGPACLLAQSGDLEGAAAAIAQVGEMNAEDAWLTLAGLLHQGSGVCENQQAAARIWQALAQEGVAQAQALWGMALVKGQGVPRDGPLGLEWLRRAAAGGFVQAWGMQSQVLRHGTPDIAPDAEAAFDLLLQGAELGDAEAWLDLASACLNGDNISASLADAFECNRRAAALGNPKGHFNLGLAYEHGRGVAQDDALAWACYQQAAEGELPEAIHNLAVLTFSGRGTQKNEAQALALYMKAASCGMTLSCFALGDMFMHGRGCHADAVEALSWFLLGAASGHEPSQAQVRALVKALPTEQVAEAFSRVERFGGCEAGAGAVVSH
jgi:uncharacterized protein